MTASSCVPALESYLSSLHAHYEVRKEGVGCLLETPFYLPDNTRLGVHLIERPGGRFEVTDHGETVDALFTGGVTLPADDKRLIAISRRFGVTVDGGEISRTSDGMHLDDAINAVVHAILDTAYLVYTRSTRAAPNFMADVEHALIDLHRPYDKRYEVVGYTDVHTFDYHLSGRQAPLLIETLSAKGRQSSYERARVTSFKVFDTKRAPAGETYEFVCLVDDRTPEQQDAITERTMNTLRGYLDEVILWSERHKVEALLAA